MSFSVHIVVRVQNVLVTLARLRVWFRLYSIVNNVHFVIVSSDVFSSLDISPC